MLEPVAYSAVGGAVNSFSFLGRATEMRPQGIQLVLEPGQLGPPVFLSVQVLLDRLGSFVCFDSLVGWAALYSAISGAMVSCPGMVGGVTWLEKAFVLMVLIQADLFPSVPWLSSAAGSAVDQSAVCWALLKYCWTRQLPSCSGQNCSLEGRGAWLHWQWLRAITQYHHDWGQTRLQGLGFCLRTHIG